jgi:hypothetical protein
VDAWSAVLATVYVQRARLQAKLVDSQVDQLRDPQRVAVGKQDEQPVARRISGLASSREEFVDLRLGEVLALAVGGIRLAAGRDCRLFRLPSTGPRWTLTNPPAGGSNCRHNERSTLDRYLRSHFHYPSCRNLKEVGCIASGFCKADK